MTNPEPFDAANARRTFRIGTADLKVDLFWHGLRRRAERFAPGVDFHTVPTQSKASATTQIINAEADVAISSAPRRLVGRPHPGRGGA